MSLSYAKVFSSLPESTVWMEPYHVRIAWVTLLITCDRDGVVETSILGLAKRANITLAEAEESVQRFLSPDRHSRTPDNDGRRIEPIPGGWKILNYGKYRDMMRKESRNESKRAWWERNRAGGKGRPDPDAASAPAQIPAAQSQESARQAIEESRQAAESAVPMPEHIRAILGES